uniref:SLC41A/MgtE integral membrane domain-containing protein n=1 Tax=Anopheles atroparvus TaxID=41427 RepID=A0A182J9E1_ANOAO
MKPNETTAPMGGGGRAADGAAEAVTAADATAASRRDSVVPFDTIDAVLLESQGPMPFGSRAASQRSSLSSAGTAPLPHTLIALDTAMAFRAGQVGGPPGVTRAATEFYRVDDDSYRPFTIYGGNAGDGTGKLPASTTGSLSSIITTSIASSDPDRGDHRASGSCYTGSLAGDVGDLAGPLQGKLPVMAAAERAGDGADDAGADGTGGGANAGSELAPGGTGGDGGGHGPPAVLRTEKWWQTTIQIAVPFFIAGFGTIAAGIILGRVENWNVFTQISELFILVPALLGLKGNLDMCLASRMSTQANLGNLNGRREIVKMIIGNIALVQVQAIVAAFIVSIFAIVVGAIMNQSFRFDHAMLITASSMFTATSSCFVLDFVLVAVILFTKRFKLNPDNLATPLAASIGDVVSISILSGMASLLFDHIKTHLWVTFVMVIGYFVLLPFFVLVVYRNKYTSRVLTSGWVPVLSSLFISGMGGLVLDTAVGMFNGFVVFQPIINGIGGNLVSVQASKISTMLHQSSILGIIPPHARIYELPWRALFHGVPYAKTARILIMMSIPGQVLFIFVADYIHMSRSTIGFPFVLTYLFVSTLQIMLLLYIAHVIIHLMWKMKIDPDNSAIPYLTALGDLLGSSFLMLAFLFLRSIGHPYGEDKMEQVAGFTLLTTETYNSTVLSDLIHEGSGF